MSGSQIDGFWHRRTPGEKTATKWRLTRTPQARKMVGVCLSSDLIGCPTHWFGNRTVPCFHPHPCDAHDKGVEVRWKLYIAALVGRDREPCIVEMTNSIEGIWDEAFCMYRTLRGLIFELSRINDRDNGQLHLRLKPRQSKLDDLPRCPDVAAILFKIWEVPDIIRSALPLNDTPLERRQKQVGE